MLSKTTTHLRIRRPSPTTVEYTVSTAPTPTFPLRLLHLLSNVIRVVLSVGIILVLYAKYRISPLATPLTAYLPPPPLFSYDYMHHLHQQLICTALFEQLVAIARELPLRLALPLALAVLYVLARRFRAEESLLVLRGLGIQTASSSRVIWGAPNTRFIPTEKIQDILVNEAFLGFEVRYLLVVVVQGEAELLVVFPRLLPGKDVVERVWRGARACLFEGVGKGIERKTNG